MASSNKYFVQLTDKSEDDKSEDQEECLFCFDNVDLEKSFIGCDTCGTNCHANCYIDWFNRKNDSSCISCQQRTLIYSETKITMLMKCLSFIGRKKPTYAKKFYKIV